MVLTFTDLLLSLNETRSYPDDKTLSNYSVSDQAGYWLVY